MIAGIGCRRAIPPTDTPLTFDEHLIRRSLLYAVEPELRIPELAESRFDLAFIDGPPASFFRHFARLNAIEFAAARTDVILLHDANREMERSSMLVMEEKGCHWRAMAWRGGWRWG